MSVGILRAATAMVVVAALIGVVPPASAGFACTPAVRLDPGPPVLEGVPVEFFATLTVQPGCPLDATARYHTEAPAPGGSFDATPGTSGSSPLADYITTSGTLTWSGGPPTQKVSVPTLKDKWTETAEEIRLCFEQPGGPPPVIICVGIPVNESTPMCRNDRETYTFDINLAVPVRQDVLLRYRTIDGTAKAGEDFVGVREGQAKILAGTVEARPKPSVQTLPNRPGKPVEYFDVEFTAVVDQVAQTSRTRIATSCG